MYGPVQVVLAGLYIVLIAGMVLGSWSTRAGMCNALWDNYVEASVEDGGCGGDLNNCPVETPSNWEQYFDVYREECMDAGVPLPE